MVCDSGKASSGAAHEETMRLVTDRNRFLALLK